MKAIDIHMSRNSSALFSFDGWLAKEVSVGAAIIYNHLAYDDYDWRLFIKAGLDRKDAPSALVDGELVWIRYKSEVLFKKLFPFYAYEEVLEYLGQLENAGFVYVKEDRGSGFTWVACRKETEDERK